MENFSEIFLHKLSSQLLNQFSISGGEIKVEHFCYSFFFRKERSFECIWQGGYEGEQFAYSFLQENSKILKPVLKTGFAILPFSENGFIKSSSLCAIVESAINPKYLLLTEFSPIIGKHWRMQDESRASESQHYSTSLLQSFLRFFLVFLIQQFWLDQKGEEIFLPLWLEKILNDPKIFQTKHILVVAEKGSAQEEFVAKLLHKHGKINMRHVRFFSPSRLSSEVQNREIFGVAAGARLGHEAGAIGLVHQRSVEAIVIQEIADLDLEMQEKLFQHLTTGRFGQLWIFETSRDLSKMVEAGKFSPKLYELIHPAVIILPPLRVKKKRLLAECYRLLNYFSHEYARKTSLTPAAEKAIAEHHWPGNWQELKSTLELAFHLSNDKVIDLEHLRFIQDVPTLDLSNLNLRKNLREMEKKMILQAYSLHAGNQVQMAKALGISRGSLQYKLQRYLANPSKK